MKVFFTAAQRGKKELGEQYKKILSSIKDIGYNSIDDSIINISGDDFYKNFEDMGKDEHEKFYNKILASLRKSDINVFECSFPSLGIGYQITKSLEYGKPTIILYFENTPSHLFFAGADDDRIIMRSYTDKTIKKVIKEVMELARERRDKRFNFFISPRLLDYLEQSSGKDGITKSKFIRDLIVNKMRTQNVPEEN
jgi:hypothetical protein